MTTTTFSSSTSTSSIPVQPDHFYGHEILPTDQGYFDPNDDPSASRGIPVFRPTIDEFEDFEGYLNKVECWGMKSGIIKIIPPPEWTSSLPSTKPQLKHVKLRNPIEQDFSGSGGLFRQQNIEKRRIMSVREWAEQCKREDMRAPTIEEAQGGRRYAAPSPRGPKKLNDHECDDDADVAARSETRADIDVDPTSTLPTPPATTASHSPPNAAGSPPVTAENYNSPASTPVTARRRRTANERQRAKEILDDAFLTTFDPHMDWLPKDMKPADYTPEFCRTLERMYWRSCGFGKAPWYGADMKGSLFTPATKHWNVATLPSALSRLLGSDSQISGVNTPYLYFGMWRATFAWHVEDMDLFSINYIHFGAPKFWYAMPQSRASNLETTMKGYFPRDISNCPQFLRHKSFLASPPKLDPARPNTLVQHAGEFVVTFPRGYHAGFNLGFNCAESVNFALESWIELGKKAAYCACIEDSVKIDVVRLLKEREMERNGNGVMTDKGSEHASVGSMPNKKRKVEVFIGPMGSESPPKAKRPKTSVSGSAKATSTAASSKSRPKSNTSFPPASLSQPLPAPTHFPCCLCPSSSTDGLLRVHDPPSGPNTPSKPPPGTPWRAHELCAKVVPETWIDEDPDTVSGIDGEKERVVWGVDGIVKDRWMLKCSVCTRPASKSHGAPIQCTKGKCSKAFHVTCAAEAATSSETAGSPSSAGAGVGYRVLEEVEKEVVLIDDAMDVDPPNATAAGEEVPLCANTGVAGDDVQPSSSLSTDIPMPPVPVAPRIPNVIKTIKKLLVEVLCSQHNPASIALKKASRDERLIRDIDALKDMDRIRIRNSSGVFEVSLVQVNKDRRTVEVLWDGGQKREFKWGSIVWSWSGETGRKPTAEGALSLGF
ncbi:JmjC-domain-containing protein [Hysterangium stoloniferum]|nr:JmjC-domain-containing protein [Hysterangium stoloniferum]